MSELGWNPDPKYVPAEFDCDPRRTGGVNRNKVKLINQLIKGTINKLRLRIQHATHLLHMESVHTEYVATAVSGKY